MTDNVDGTTRKPGRLASIFDAFPPGTPLSLDALELAMARDTENRCLAALDRALARLAAPALPTLPSPVTPEPPT
jgi:hypothetical protein